MAVWALGFLKPESGLVRQDLSSLLGDDFEVRIFEDNEIRRYKVYDLATGLLGRLR
jgi:hypothetical protein